MIKFLDLQKINAQYANELILAATEVINSGWYLTGERIKQFEKNLSDFLNVKFVTTCANGLDALRLIIRAYIEMGAMKEGDEVIVPANTFIASILAITDNKLKPVFIEPDQKTYNLDLSKIESAISTRTRAILVVHLYGQICWSNLLDEIAVKYNLKLIEDNAQAIGAMWIDGRRSGNLGFAAGLSFYPGKNLGALGDSGAVVTNDKEIARIVRTIANYGSTIKYTNEYRGLNSRMDEIQAVFLDIKLKHLDQENNIRRKIANYYINNIKNNKIKLPEFDKSNENAHVWHLFVIRVKERDSFQNYLSDKGIQTLIHYPIPPHKQKCYEEFNKHTYPLTELMANEVISLPISAVMEIDEMNYIVEAINQW